VKLIENVRRLGCDILLGEDAISLQNSQRHTMNNCLENKQAMRRATKGRRESK
jgi:hypothetical protein